MESLMKGHVMVTRRLSVPAFVLVLSAALVMSAPAQGQEPKPSIRCYASDIHDSTDAPLGDGPAAISLAATRGGTFSGKVVVASPTDITGLKATITEIRHTKGQLLDPTLVQVRYGVPWDTSIGSHNRPRGGDILLESPLEKVPAGRGGAKIPIWVTITIPPLAKCGPYEGTLTVAADGLPAVKVPVRVGIGPWTVPEPGKRTTWIEMLQSPDTLSVEYDVPLWSDRHWQMVDTSLKWIADAGSRVVCVPLIARTNQGHSESMVRWIPKGDGTYEHDFTVMERYLDLACKHMGKPQMVVFYAWEIYLKPPKEEIVFKEGDSRYVRMEKTKKAARWELRNKGAAVTTLNPASGKTDTVYLPRYDNPRARTLWTPLWSALKKRMADRGLADVMMLGTISDVGPNKEETALLRDLSGGLPWVSCSHHMRWVNHKPPPTENQLHGMATIAYPAVALDFQYTLNPAHGRMYGWKKPVLHAIYWRFRQFNTSSAAWIRGEPECNITGNQRGIGHLGADFWSTIRDKRGRRVGTVAERYPESYWHSLNVGSWMLGPGPRGPVGTARLEVLREGLQAAEARIAIERVLTNDTLRDKIGDKLATDAQALLDRRQLALWKSRGATKADLDNGLVLHYRALYPMQKKWKAADGTAWFIASGWAGEMSKLFDMANQVQQAASQ
jgi:hypothetical protein